MMNKKAMSGIVTTVITLGLVIVVIGVVWTIITNVIESNSEEIDYSQQCLGISLKVDSVSCSDGSCSVVVKRALGSKSDSFDGIGVTLSNDLESGDEVPVEGNIAVSKTVPITTDLEATKADVRFYVDREDGEKYWCSQIASYP